MSTNPRVESLPPADDDVDAGTPEWDAMADRWGVLQTLLARQVDDVETIAAELEHAVERPLDEEVGADA